MTTFVAPPDQTRLVLNNGDQLIVNSGGEATATTVSGGIIEVLKGGTTIGTTINRGLEVDSGTAINTTLNETGAFQVSLQVKDGGTAIGTIINSSSQQTTQLIISSGSTSFDTIINGGLESVQSGGTSTGTKINSGGLERVFGNSMKTIINKGGTENVADGGTSTDTIIHNGGVEDVGGLFGAGTSTDTTIDEGGIENVRSGGKALGTIISGGTENVAAGGTSIGTIIREGTENVAAGGTSTGTTIRNGGVEIVAGKSTGTTIEAGGIENVLSGGTSTGTNISGGTENVQGTAIKTIIDHGTENVQSGGTATDVIFAGAHSTLELATPSGLNGTINNWHVGDVIDFLNTAVTDAHVMNNVLTVTFGNQNASYKLAGREANTEFKLQSDRHGGTELILKHSGGTAVNTTVLQGVDADDQATTINTKVEGGSEIVGAATATVSEGMAFIYAGGGLQNGLTLGKNGTAEIHGSLTSGTVTFTGPGGDLKLFNLPDFAAVIAGFGKDDLIDLGNFAFSSDATVSFSSGTLTVTNGNQHAALSLSGLYSTSNFALASDGAHGTLIKSAFA